MIARRESRISESRRTVWRLLAAAVAVSGLAFGSGLRGEGYTAGDLSELTAAGGTIETLLSGNAIFVGETGRGPKPDSEGLSRAFPDDAPILAYEEHARFVYAVGDASGIARVSGDVEDKDAIAKVVRRFISLRPRVFVLDDLVEATAGTDVRWIVGCGGDPALDGSRLRRKEGGEELVCQTVWPRQTVQEGAGDSQEKASVPSFEVEQVATAGGARFVHVVDVRNPGVEAATVQSASKAEDDRLELTITTAEQTFRLSLPPPGAGDAGWITVNDADGEALVPRRPLASGVLPHGEEGRKLLERWDSAYRGDRTAGWDTGKPAPELKRVVEGGLVTPCRTVVLGCGSGTNAVYLAQHGFQVTGIDVAPTALGIAAEKAEKAKVRVRWVLADVLALPAMETFDFIFDRGCYHNVRYVDAARFVASLRRLSGPAARCLILSLDRDSPPGVREKTMRDDLEPFYEFEWLRDSGVEDRDGNMRRESWSLMMRRRDEPPAP